ncbi:hypothetical protein OHD16_06355 [Sphingobacterium sp. ML3W]|uniref:hypothetical protein n=1 Tax=Sphingobacterium sp. ML3W TaxID=1538644 RepID=UPI00249B2D81|nr:hypothetical protein [Sphingobacterium sp. ML3W]WFA79590.1 hypothetical protein OGI71_26595 [Sphingobacterium sp. ML3W]
MRKLLILCKLTVLLCISCKQKQFDLSDLRFPIEKKQLNTLGVKTDPYKTFLEEETMKFISDSSSVMRFGGIALAGNLNRYDKHIYASNNVEFFEDREDKAIQAYKIAIQTTEETELLAGYFDQQFGKTDFYYKDKEVSCRVWEKEGMLYYLGINFDVYDPERIAKHLKTALLFVVNKTSQTLIKEEAPQSSYFRFYKYYLEAKEQPEYKTFTYRQYMQLKSSQDQSEGLETIYVGHYIKQ